MRRTFVVISMASGVPLSELLEWHPRDFATLVDLMEERIAAQKRRK